MTFHGLILEEFAAKKVTSAARSMEGAELEALRLEAYEAGYKSGWEDADTERTNTSKVIAVGLERNLADISFTYQEARAEVLNGLGNLLEAMTAALLPALAAEALAPLLQQELSNLADQLNDVTCLLVANENGAQQLQWLVDTYLEADLRISIEPAYPDGRVTLKFKDESRDIDLSRMVEQITAAVRDFSNGTQIEEVTQYG